MGKGFFSKKLKFGIVTVGIIFAAGVFTNATKTPPAGQHDTSCQITKIIDGDTVDIHCGSNQVERIRILGYDTPETYYAECPAEKKLGNAATEFLRQLVANQPEIEVLRQGSDRYQRTLAQIWIMGEDISDIMINANLAVAYAGSQRISWCERIQNARDNG